MKPKEWRGRMVDGVERCPCREVPAAPLLDGNPSPPPPPGMDAQQRAAGEKAE